VLFRGDPDRADAISRDLPRAMRRLADRISSLPPPAADPD